MSNLQSCMHLSMLEAVLRARICDGVVVDDGSASAYVPSEEIASDEGPRGETIHFGPVSVLDSEVAISQFDETSATIALVMEDGRVVTIAMVRRDADVVLH